MNVTITTTQNHTYRVDAIENGAIRTPVNGEVDTDEIRARCKEAVMHSGVFLSRARDGSRRELMVPGREVRQVTFLLPAPSGS